MKLTSPPTLALQLGALLLFGGEQAVAGLRYLPRQDSANGRIKDYRIFLSKETFAGLKSSVSP
jgi:hypothetical protein